MRVSYSHGGRHGSKLLPFAHISRGPSAPTLSRATPRGASSPTARCQRRRRCRGAADTDTRAVAGANTDTATRAVARADAHAYARAYARAYALAAYPCADDCSCADARDDPYAEPYADPSRRRFSPHRYATYLSYMDHQWLNQRQQLRPGVGRGALRRTRPCRRSCADPPPRFFGNFHQNRTFSKKMH